MISSSWPSVLWFFAFLQTWFQPYVSANPLLYHGILITCIFVCICYFMFFDCCFILKVLSLFLFVLLHLLPLFCSLDYLNLLKMCPSVSFVSSWFHIKINVFRYKCCLCFPTFFRLLSQLSDPLYLCLHPLSSTNLTNVFPPTQNFQALPRQPLQITKKQHIQGEVHSHSLTQSHLL